MQASCPHVTVIACDSGTQDIAPGDEPLGIIPALLYAGATSVIGTLWPVESQAARKFSECFYEHLNGQSKVSGTRILDIAQALRSAVCEMMRMENQSTKAAVHWAAYVLHGCWFRGYESFPPAGVDDGSSSFDEVPESLSTDQVPNSETRSKDINE